jgi:hypothetical protein
MFIEPDPPKIYGMIAEFDTVEGVTAAARSAREAGFTKMDAYSPYPNEELIEALLGEDPKSKVPFLVLCGGITGGLAGFFLQYVTAVHLYALNIGGRPLNSWVAFIPITFEMTVLFSALSAILGMILLNGLPRPHHPIFNARNFERATQDRFFLCIESSDPKYDEGDTRSFLQSLNPSEVSEVES